MPKKNIARIIIVFSALFTILAIGIYVWKVGAGSDYKLSSVSERWAFFADYIAGVIGPFLSFLAFIGVLWTLNLQREQLDLLRKNALLEEVQRTLSNSSTHINSLLSEDVTNHIKSLDFKSQGNSLFKMLGACGLMALQHKKPGSEPDEDELKIVAAAKTDLKMAGMNLIYELTHLSAAIELYSAHGGPKEIKNLYIKRYQPVVGMLHELHFMDMPAQIERVFDPTGYNKRTYANGI